MKREPAWRRYLRFWGPDPASDVNEEFEFHIETKTEALINAGWAPEEARREAVRQFGPLHPIREECCAIRKGSERQESRAEYLAGWWRDIRYSGRVLSKSKASTIAAVLILAVGIGANTAVFTLLDRLFWAPLPVIKPSELVTLSTSWPGKDGVLLNNQYFTSDAYASFRDRSQVFSGLAVESYGMARETPRGGRVEKPTFGQPVSANYFQVLGVRAVLGRLIGPDDEKSLDASRVVVLSHRFWTQRFGASADALGKTIYLANAPFTVVGVLPAGFYGIRKGSDSPAYIPMAALRGLKLPYGPLDGRAHLRLIGRMRPGVKARAVESNLQPLWTTLHQKEGTQAGPGTPVERIACDSLASGLPGADRENRRSLFLLGAITALLLLMGCLNVACLLVARGISRQHETAIRFSLGAGWSRVIRQFLIESSLISLAGGAFGLLVAFSAERLLLIAFKWRERPIDLALDWRVLGFAFMLSLLTCILFGIAPAIQGLRSGRGPLNSDRTVASRFGAGRALIVIEVALSMVMLAGAAVFIRSFQNLRSVPVGFSPEHVSVISLAPSPKKAESPDNGSPAEPLSGEAAATAALEIADALSASPRIESVAVADLLTFGDSRISHAIAPEEQPQRRTPANLLRVDSRFFETLRIPLIYGRKLTDRDDERSPGVVVLGETAAHRMFPEGNPIGRRILLGQAKPEVVGVVKDIKFTKVTDPAPEVAFQPVLQGLKNSARTYTLKLHVRSRLNPDATAEAVREQIRQKRLPVVVESAKPLEEAIAASMSVERLRMQAASLFGGVALLLMTAGIYGLMAFSVARRTREIGIRMAVGSDPAGIARLIIRDSSRLLLIGIAIGVPGAMVLMKAVAGMLFGLAPVDLISMVAGAGVLFGVGIIASLTPAWRAAHLDPVRALRVQ